MKMELWKERIAALKQLPAAGRLIWQSSKGLVTGDLIARTVAALVPVAVLAISRLILDYVVAVRNHTRSDFQGIWPLLAAEFALASLAFALGPLIDYFDARLADEFTNNVSLRVMDHAARLDLAFFEDPAFHDRLERARAQATDRVAILSAAGSLLQRSIAAVSLAAGLIWYSPWLFLLLLACVLPAFVIESHFAFQGYALAHQLTPLRRELDYIRLLGSSRDHAKEIKIFALANPLRDRYQSISRQVIDTNRALARRRMWWGVVMAAGGSAGYYGGYIYLVVEALNGKISLGTLAFLAGAIAGANGEMRALFALFSNISEQSLFLTDLIHFLKEKPRLADRPGALPPPRPMRDAIEFRDVVFSYSGSDRRILDKLNFRIGVGERVALVGENGEGKTTLVKLLSRLYDPTEGQILIDGVDIRDYRVEELRQEIGVLFQDFVRYDMPVRSNIGFGSVDLINDDPALREAAKRSRIDDLIASFPGGLEQMLGRRFEGGVDLSGGQWQRIALARAYLRKAQILILDEPTSALDALAEAEVLEDFLKLTEHRTCILISHRFSTVRMADRIVVLAQGRIQEDGTHDNLVACGGGYAKLFETQAANYR